MFLSGTMFVSLFRQYNAHSWKDLTFNRKMLFEFVKRDIFLKNAIWSTVEISSNNSFCLAVLDLIVYDSVDMFNSNKK